jgi:hypothetical protein
MAYQMAFDAEAKERIADLDKEIATGIQLRNEGKNQWKMALPINAIKFYIRFRVYTDFDTVS